MSTEEQLTNALSGLADCELEMAKADRAAEIFRLKKTSEIYNKRRNYIADIPGFWSVVLSQHEDFAEYIRVADLQFIETVKNIYVDWDIISDEEAHPGNFSISFEFAGVDGDFEAQTVTKKFIVDTEGKIPVPKKANNPLDSDDEDMEEERIYSEPCDIKWPISYDSINPSKIEDKKSAEGKKNYRDGMKSFFGWFKWTGLKPGKEFPSGEELARLFAEDIFPHAVKYYAEAQRDDDEDDESDEPLDIDFSDEDGSSKRKLDEDEGKVSKKSRN